MKFRETTLGEISGGGSYGLGASSTTDSTGPKFLRTTDIVSGTIDWSHVPYCSADSVTIEKYKLFDEDIVISRTGANAGLNCLVLAPPKNAIFAGYLVRFQINRELADARYVSYVLRSSLWKDYVEVTRTGSAQPQFNAVLMSQFPISLPSLNTQKAISTLLSALDAKIAVNNGLSKTLEDIAQAIFKSWFIDFDPVKAKMVGNRPEGMDAATAALFPDSMEESKLGVIPAGWKARQLNSALKLHKSTIKAGAATDSVPYVPVDQIGSKDIFLKKSMPGLKAKTSLVSFKKNDILFGAMRPYFHKVVLAPFDGTTRTTTFVLRAINPKYLAYSLLTVYQDNAVAYATNNSQGTTIPYAVWDNNFASYPIVLPSEPVASAFNDLVYPLIEYGYSLVEENQNLARIRECLLPRLISGELQIPEGMLAS